MAAIFYQIGDVIDYTAAEALSFGEVVDLSTRIGVAGADIAKDAAGPVQVTGVYRIPKASGAVTVGQALYWDKSAQVRQEPHHHQRQHPGGLGGGPRRQRGPRCSGQDWLRG